MYQAFIGIDVSKAKLDLGWLRDPETNKVKTKVFKNNRDGFYSLSEWIIKQTKVVASEVLITIEPTGVYHEAIAMYLADEGFNVILVNVVHAKRYAQSLGHTHKTDRADSIALAKYGHAQHKELELWQPPSHEARRLEALIRRREMLKKDLVREQNRLEATEVSGVSIRVEQSLKDLIRVIENEIESLTKDIDDHIDQNPDLKDVRKRLETITGVGNVLSCEMVSLFNRIKFRSAKQLAAYLGLIPRIRKSGAWKGQSRITKTGPSHIRAKLYMGAVAAIQHNAEIKALRDRLIAKGKTKMQALVAAMRKLAQICFGVYKSGKAYEPQMQK